MESEILQLIQKYDLKKVELFCDRLLLHRYNFQKNIIEDICLTYMDMGFAVLQTARLKELSERLAATLRDTFLYQWSENPACGILYLSDEKEWEIYRREYAKFNRFIL